jgi:hypothetical protein
VLHHEIVYEILMRVAMHTRGLSMLSSDSVIELCLIRGVKRNLGMAAELSPDFAGANLLYLRLPTGTRVA